VASTVKVLEVTKPIKRSELMMDKPTKIPRDPIYNYHEVIRYIEKKYKIKTRRYKNDNLDF